MGVSLFVGEKNDSFGGMQTHLFKLIDFLKNRKQLDFVIYKSPQMVIYDFPNNLQYEVKSVDALIKIIGCSDAFFFNDGWWYEEWHSLKEVYPNVIFIYRTGGNEFVKAPYKDNSVCLEYRQKIWGDLINHSIDFVISNSRFTTQRLLDQNVSMDKILTIRGGVNIFACKENIAQRSMLRKNFDEHYQTNNKVIFAIVCRFEPFKGILETLEVFASINNRKDFFLLIVGNGTLKKEIEAYCTTKLGPTQYCILPEIDNDQAMQYIALSDYYLNCSLEYKKQTGNDMYIHTETMGRSLYEAIYQYVPVIATNVGGIAELFDEFEEIGFLIDENQEIKKEIIQDILNKIYIIRSNGLRYKEYGWDYIFSEIYAPLFDAKLNRIASKVAICLDIDGTIYHQTLSECENIANLERIISMNEVCEIIINSAANYDEILERYPILAMNKDSITIISNCGKHLFIHGELDVFWDNYMNGVPGIQAHIVDRIQKKIEASSMNLISTKYIDKLYVNFKIIGKIDDVFIREINSELKNTQYYLTYNSNNIKLISKVVNKAAPIHYLKAMNSQIQFWIGAGNNVLDFSFLDLCDVAYIVNYSSIKYKTIVVENNYDMAELICNMESEVERYFNGKK